MRRMTNMDGWRSLRHFIAVFGIVVSGTASAACGSYYCAGPVTALYVADTAVYIVLGGTVSGLTNCTPESGVYLTLPKSNSNYSSYYALLLAHKTTGESLQIRTNDGSSGCTVGYMYTPG